MNYQIKTRPKIPRNKYGYLAPSSTGGANISNVTNSTNTEVTIDDVGHATEADHSLKADLLTNTVKLWGNDFNGTVDVTGTILVSRIDINNIYPLTEDFIDVYGYVSIMDSLYVSNNLTVDEDVRFSSGLEVESSIWCGTDISVDGDIGCGRYLIVDQAIYDSGLLEVEGVTNLHDTTYTCDLYPQDSNLYVIGSEQNRYKGLFTSNIDNSDSITTKNLTVTGSAHFFELIIDKIKSVGGAALFTPADGFTIDKVEHITNDSYNRYRIFWKNTDGEGNVRVNMWQRGDQALCMTFNKATTGTTTDVSNKYYWCYVPWTSNDEALNNTDYDDEGYNFIDIIVNEGEDTKADGTVNPEIGDNIVMCGHRRYGLESEQDAIRRGSAIYIASYAGLDSELKAPFIAQYRGIKTFDLTPYRKSYFDATGAEFIGNFQITPDQMTQIANQVNVDVHDPYIDGNGYWVIWKDGDWVTTDIKAQGTDGHSPYIEGGYWYYWNGTEYVKGNKATGNDATQYRLFPVIELAVVKSNENLDITLDYIVYKLEGNSTPVDFTENIMGAADPNWWYIVFKDNIRTHSTIVPFAKYNNTYLTNYFSGEHTDIRSITVSLYNGNLLYDSRTIQVIFEPSATFEVNLLLGSISARVTGTEANISGLTSRVSEVELTATGLTARVSANETNITGVSNRVTTVEATANGLTTSVGNLNTELGITKGRLSTVEQTSDIISSKVSKMNLTGNRINLLPESNFTGRCNNIRYIGSQGEYNTIVKNAYLGMNSYRAFIPVTDNLIYNGVRWGADNYKAIKVIPNRRHTLTFYAKANVADSVGRCEVHKTDGLYGNRVNGNSFGSEFVLTNLWQQYTMTFIPEFEFLEVFIFTYNARGATATADTVQDIEICMPLLTNNGVTEYSLSTEDKEVVQGNLLDNTNDFTVGGNLLRVVGTKGNFELSNGKYLYCNATSGYEDILKWVIDGNKLQSNKDYVISFYAKADTAAELEVILYNSDDPRGHPQARYSDTSDGTQSGYYTYVNLTDSYVKCFVHFHTINDPYNTVNVLLRVQEGFGVYIALPKLEIGADHTEWTTSTTDYETPSNVSSKIEQSATEITLSVSNDLRDTGINIQDGVISLNASNTVVSDNLSVGSLKTTGEQATIEIKDGAMKVFGDNKEQPNIIFGIDDNGFAVLSYYDNNGNLLYNLGPDGIMKTFTETYNKFGGAVRFIRIDNGTTLNNSFASVDIAGGTPYYKFTEGYKMIGNVKQYKISGTSIASTYNLSYYNSNSMSATTDGLPTGTRMSNGWYFNGLQSPTVNDKYKIVEAINISAGKQVNKMNIYVAYSGSVWRLADQNFNIVSNKTPSEYRNLTNQTSQLI